MSRPIPPSYKIRNWPAYNEALKRRGSLTIWFDPDMVWVPSPTGKRGRQRQVAELQIRAAVLNGYTALGIPNTQPVE